MHLIEYPPEVRKDMKYAGEVSFESIGDELRHFSSLYLLIKSENNIYQRTYCNLTAIELTEEDLERVRPYVYLFGES